MVVVPLLSECLGGRPNTYQKAGVRRGTATSNSTKNETSSSGSSQTRSRPASCEQLDHGIAWTVPRVVAVMSLVAWVIVRTRFLAALVLDACARDVARW